MTTEQKAKAYDEALERAKKQLEEAKVFDYEEGQIALDIRTTTYAIFPELKESEDERIRKFLVELVSNDKANNFRGFYDSRKIDCDNVLAWLEKQKGQKPAEWNEEDKHRCGDAIYFLETAKKHYADTSEIELTIDWLKSLRPQLKVEAEPVDLEKEIDACWRKWSNLRATHKDWRNISRTYRAR